MPPSLIRKWEEAEVQILRARYESTPTAELANALGRSVQAVRDYACKVLKIKRDQSAHLLQKGHKSWNRLPIGTERFLPNRGLIRKVTHTGKPRKDYVQVKILVWQEAGRTIPDGHFLSHKDGNKRNCTLENLELLSVSRVMKARQFQNLYPNEIVKAHLQLARLHQLIKQKKEMT